MGASGGDRQLSESAGHLEDAGITGSLITGLRAKLLVDTFLASEFDRSS
jgi:hypothetical protein